MGVSINTDKKDLIGLFCLIIGCPFLIPFAFSFSTLDPLVPVRFLIWSVLTFGLFMLVLFKGQNAKTDSYTTRFIFSALFCFLLIGAVSLTRSVNFSEGIFEWLKIFLASVFLYTSSVILGSNDNGILYLTRSVILCGMLLALIGILQYFDIAFTSIPGYYRIYSTMVNKNLLASGLFLTLPFILFGIFQFTNLWQITSQISFAIVISAIALCGTRTVWVAIIISGSVTMSFIIYLQRKKVVNTRFYIHKLFVFILICPLMFIYTIHLSLAEKSNRTFFSSASLQERQLLWEKTWNMIKEKPSLGVGLGQWKIRVPSCGKIDKHIESEEGKFEVLFQRPHNDYLWVLSETGLPGFFCYFAFFVFVIFYALRIIFKHKNPEKKMLAVFMLSGILGYMVIGFFSFPKERPFHLIFLMLISACILSTCHHAFPVQKKDYPSKSGKILISILLIFCIFFGYYRMVSEIHACRALDARKAFQWERLIAEIDEADKWFYNMDPSSTPLSWYRGMANFSLGRIPEALKDFRRACEIHPYHVYALNNAATCFALCGDSENALRYYQRAFTISSCIY